MSHSLHTDNLMQESEDYKSLPNRSTLDPDDPLRMEKTWGDVVSGLDRILVGYLVLLLCALGVGFLVVVVLDHVHIMQTGTQEEKENSAILGLWVIYLGFGLVGIAILISSWVILVGKVRCAYSVADRYGARWFIFACLVCLATGPILNMAISIGLRLTDEEISIIRTAIAEGKDPIPMMLTSRLGVLNILLSSISIAGSIFFVLFLRSVGRCFNDNVLTTMVDFYLFFHLMVISASTLFYMQMFNNIYSLMISLGILIGMVVTGLWYIVLIFYTRVRIQTCLSNMKSPLDEDL